MRLKPASLLVLRMATSLRNSTQRRSTKGGTGNRASLFLRVRDIFVGARYETKPYIEGAYETKPEKPYEKTEVKSDHS